MYHIKYYGDDSDFEFFPQLFFQTLEDTIQCAKSIYENRNVSVLIFDKNEKFFEKID